jgi:hypothetical protein
MGTRVKFAVWRKDGKWFRVKPPDWPKHCEYSCKSQEDLIEWAKANHYMLKDGNGGNAYARPRARDARRDMAAV